MARNYVLYLLLGFTIYQSIESRLKRLDVKVGVNVKFVERKIESENGVCITNECNKIAQELLEYVDFNKRPCIDFYDFACGKFMRNDSIPLSLDNIHNFDYIHNVVSNNTVRMLESQITPEHKINEKEAIKFYESCMNLTMIESRGVAPLMEFLETYQGWPLLKGNNWNEREVNLNIIMTSIYEQGTNGLFKIYLRKDPKTKLGIIMISQPDAVFPIDYYKDKLPESRQVTALVNYITDFGVHLSNESMRNQIRSSANKIKDFKADISGCINQQQRSKDAIARRITLLEYNEHFGNVIFDLHAILQILLERHGDINNYDKIIIKEPKYLNCLNTFLKRKNKREIVDYLFWEFIESFVYAMPRVYRERRTEFLENINDDSEYSSRKHTCIILLEENLVEALDAYYARTYITKETKNKVKEIVRHIKKSFINVLKANTKMDHESKAASIKKLKHMRELIGYPDHFENETYFSDMFSFRQIDSNKSFIENVMTARRIQVNEGWRYFNLEHQPKGPRVADFNAYFNHNFNTQEITAGILLPPLYSDNFPMFWNYGGLGVVSAHEITHGFGEYGRNYDENGNYKTLWRRGTVRNFDIQGECYKRQYDVFVVPQVNRKINGSMTLDENIADNVGLKIAYLAYINWLKVNGDEPRLPGFNFTSRQMFFISFGRYFCAKPRLDALNDILDTGVHSTSTFRVIGSLRNSVEFAETFQCREGEPMNPTEKCTYW